MEKILNVFVDEGGDTGNSGILFGDEIIEKYATGFLGLLILHKRIMLPMIMSIQGMTLDSIFSY